LNDVGLLEAVDRVSENANKGRIFEANLQEIDQVPHPGLEM
jgi:hypothetical protein